MRIETSSMLIGSSARTTFGSTASARAIATLCRWPPESSCGYLAAMSSGGNEPDRAQQLVHPLLDLARRDDVVDPKRTLDVVAHRLHRIERAEGVLEDDLDLGAVAKDVAPPPDVRDVVPLEQDLPRGRLGQVGEQARDGALPAAALADERRDRARAQLERHVVDGVDVRTPNAVPEREVLRQAAHLEGGRCRHSIGLRHEMARDLVPRLDHAQPWTFGRLAPIELGLLGNAVRATRMEAAPGRRVAQVRGRAGDPGQRDQRAAQRREGLHEALRVRVLRVCAEPLGGCGLDDLARVHDRDPVCELEQERQVVRDEEHREAEVALERLDLLEDLALDDDVQGRRRLVEDDQLRLQGEGHGDHDPLAHASRELVRIRA